MSFDTTTAKTIVHQFIDALNNEDFDTASALLSPDFKFDGVLGSRNGADVYMEDMAKMKLKYSILRTFFEGDDVVILYDITMGEEKVYSAGWYTVEHKLLKSLKVVFDPRPVLQDKIEENY